MIDLDAFMVAVAITSVCAPVLVAGGIIAWMILSGG
jgi:hypothetical protein